ncbi:MAG TPA: hypothetical protein DDZ51_06080, partial [Planctomycetaceae bacterium]|nr:hypothetical protein [Planctomycetaceae bacterium]
MMRQTRLNIRWRLTIWNALAFAFILVAFGIGVYQLLRQAHFDMLDKSLKNRLVTLEESLQEGSSVEDAIRDWVGKFGEHSDYFAFVCDGLQNTVGATATLNQVDINRLLPNLINDYGGTAHDSAFGRIRYASREVQSHGQPLRIYVLAELEHLDEELLLVRRTFLFAIPPALVLSAALSYLLAVRALSPVEKLRLKTDSISATDLHERIAIANPNDEIGHLTATINSLLARLDESFDEIKRFTADASHELRTPIAIIRSEAEMGLHNDADHSRTNKRLSSIVEECGRLTNLTSQLLALSRAESSINKSNMKPISIDRLLTEVVEALEPLA